MRFILHSFIGLLAAAFMASCESTFDGNITGTYTNLTDNSNTEITIRATADGYSFTCIFDDNREENITTYHWSGTFKNVPTDMVLDADLKNIGSVEFAEGMVIFKAKTQRPDTYKAYSDDMADLMRSRTNQSPTDSIAEKASREVEE